MKEKRPPSPKEKRPPSPPKGPPTPRLYMTPHLAKRKDGLCPSLLQKETKRDKPGYLSKNYRTNSNLMLQVKERDGIPKELTELQTIIECVTKALKSAARSGAGICSLSFKPEGCIWKMEFDPSLDRAAESYKMQVICSANKGHGYTHYMVDTILVPKIPVDPDPLKPSPPGFKAAKPIFEMLSLKIRKSIVALEFPEFPEGCKDKQFKEVYQLNARVSRRLRIPHGRYGRRPSPHSIVLPLFYVEQLKSGSFATVCRGTHRATGRKVAIKCVLRKDLPLADDAAIYDEVAIMASLNHPHIVPIIDFFDEKDCYFIVMELMSGGDLFDRIGQKKSYSEADARDLVVKMLKAVSFCHRRKIAHCDMKPKNLLLMSDDNDSFIKLADFGFAARVHRPKSLTKQCGTPFFVAPEILKRHPYDQQSDMWSVGCIVFLLLSGSLPFMGRSQKELFSKIVSGKFVFKEEEWAGVSDDAKDLVSKMLVLDPDRRITSENALRHPWLKLAKDRLSKIGLQSTSQRLKTFNAKMKLRSAMIAVDWISGLKQASSRSLLSGASSGSSTKQDALVRNRNRRANKARERDGRGSKGAAHHKMEM